MLRWRPNGRRGGDRGHHDGGEARSGGAHPGETRGASEHGIGARFALARKNFPRSSIIFSESEGMSGAVRDELEYFGEVLRHGEESRPDTVGIPSEAAGRSRRMRGAAVSPQADRGRALAFYRERRGASEPRGRELKVCGTPAHLWLAIYRETRGASEPHRIHQLLRIRGILGPIGPVPLSIGSIKRYRDTMNATK